MVSHSPNFDFRSVISAFSLIDGISIHIRLTSGTANTAETCRTTFSAATGVGTTTFITATDLDTHPFSYCPQIVACQPVSGGRLWGGDGGQKFDFCLTYRAMKHFRRERCGRWAIRDTCATCLPYFSVYIYIYTCQVSTPCPQFPSTTNLILCFDTCPLLYIIQAKRESFFWGRASERMRGRHTSARQKLGFSIPMGKWMCFAQHYG